VTTSPPQKVSPVPGFLYVALGALVWGAAWWTRDPGLTRAMLWFGILVIGPLAMLVSRPDGFIRVAFFAALPTGALLAFAEFPHGLQAAPYFAVTVLIALRGAWLALTRKPGRDTIRAAGFVYVGVAGAWTWAEAAGVHFGFGPVIALLTGVHFHYAGFALQALAWRAASNRAGLLAGWGTTVGTPLVGVSFWFNPTAELVASVFLASAVVLVAAVQARQARRMKFPANVLIWLSSLSVLAGMVLAVGYPAGIVFETYWLSIPTMVKTHGMLNGFGFCLCGLLARLMTGGKGTQA
jgi:hypothetical protein